MTDKKTEAPARSALKLALEGAANYIDTLGGDSRKYRQALAQSRSDDEQPAQQCNHCNGSGRMMRDPDIGTDQECFVCEGSGIYESEQPAIKQDLTPEQHQCKFPMCHNEEYQQALAEQIKRELYTGEPALKFTDKMSIDVPVQFLFQKQPAPVAEPRKPQEPVDKRCPPCPEFWDWLPRAYNFEGLGNFTKYNMEVAFLAGMQSTHLPAQPQQEPFGWVVEHKHGGKCFSQTMAGVYTDTAVKVTTVYTSPPYEATPLASQSRSDVKPWVGLTDDEIEEGLLRSNYAFVTALAWRQGVEWAEAKLKEKNSD